MICPKCDSSSVNVQMVSEITSKPVGRGVGWWLVVGWWWAPLKWLFLTIPALIVKILTPRKQKIQTTHKKMGICQSCGQSWRIK